MQIGAFRESGCRALVLAGPGKQTLTTGIRPSLQAGMARLGHGDDAADLPAGDPAAIEQAFVVLTAIIGLLTAGYAASLRRTARPSGM